MIRKDDLQAIAKARLEDAKALIIADRFDGAVYLCGYVIELALKFRICDTLKWEDYPDTRSYQSFKTHDLDVLLHLSGREKEMKTNPGFLADWFVVTNWDPEIRYKPVGTASNINAQEMISATERLFSKI